MAHKKQTKRSHIKRCVKRVLGTMAALTVLLCVLMVAFMALLEYGIVELDSKKQVEAKETAESNSVDTSSLYQEIERSVETKLEEKDTESICQIQDDRFESKEIDEVSEELVVYPELEEYDTQDQNSIVIETIGEVDEKFLKAAKKELSLIPEVLRKSFIQEGWRFNITDENIRKKCCGGEGPELVGYTDYDEYEINVASKWSGVMVTPSHEMGHYLDYINGFPSKSKEFQQIYLEEGTLFKANALNSEWISDSTEFFAEEFAYYVVDPSKCTPKAYAYIESQLNILKERSD